MATRTNVVQRRLAATAAVAVSSALVYSSNTTGSAVESTRGLVRQAYFWSQLTPVLASYYWKLSSTSPYVKFQKRYYTEEDWKVQRAVLQQSLHHKHAPQVLQTMIELKGLYIKLGQVLSVTALPIPEVYRTHFRALQSNVPGWNDYETVIKPILEREWNNRPVIQSIEEVPCGAASIGQAHKAVLQESNTEVVIKVQYPDAAWQVAADIECVGQLIRFCVWMGVIDESAWRLSFAEFARQFQQELDYEQECRNLQAIYTSSLDPTAPYIQRGVMVPRPLPEWCTDKVLVMTYLPGGSLEQEARRQLELLGIDTSRGMRDAFRGHSTEALRVETEDTATTTTTESIDEKKKDTLNTTNGSSSSSTTTTARSLLTRNIDELFQLVRFWKRIRLWVRWMMVSAIDIVPFTTVATKSWVDANRTVMKQAQRLNWTKDWVDALYDVHGHQIFVLGLFNGDPHPGNILVIDREDDEDEKKQQRLGLIDYGQCKRLTRPEQVRIARLLLTVANNGTDDEIATAFRDLEIRTKNDSTEFLATMGRLMFGPLHSEYLDHAFHRRLHRMDSIVYFPKELSMVYRSALLLRGLAFSLQLNTSIGEQWRHHAEALLKTEGLY